MKVELSGLITDIRGSLGNATASKNKHGNYIKSYAMPSTSLVPQNMAVRQWYSSIVATWNGLSGSVKAQWAASAATYTFKNNIGNNYTPSGFQLFIYVNMNIYGTDLSIITTPVNYHSVAQGTIGLSQPIIHLHSMILSFPLGAPTGQSIKIYSSDSYNQGVDTSVLFTRMFYVWNPGAGTIIELWPKLIAILETPPVAGAKILYQVVFIERATGLPSAVGSAETIFLA